MATEVKVVWYGDRVLRSAESRKEAFLVAAGQVVQAQAIANITTQRAVDTGRLRASITYNSREDRSFPRAYKTGGPNQRDGVTEDPGDDSVNIGTNVSYGPYIEFGTVRSRPRPYLRPALTLSRRNVKLLAVKIMRF